MDRPTKKAKTKSVSIRTETQPKVSAPSTLKSMKKVERNGDLKTASTANRDHGATSTSLTKEKRPEPKSRIPQRLVIVSGSYDKILYGLQIEPKSQGGDDGPQFKPIFIFPAHIACVKAVTASPQGGKWLASGGTDEIVKVWDLRRRKELGSLQQHQGSVTHLSFPTRAHLLSASEDGTICLYHTRDWSVLATLKGHRDRVNDLAVHPSAKVCLSVGKDRTLRMWDLMRGKGSASLKLGKEGECVRWTPTGTRFAISSGSNIDIYSTKMSLLQSVTHAARIHDIFFCQGLKTQEILLVAAEDKRVTLFELPEVPTDEDQPDNVVTTTLPIIAYLTGHTNRVKALDVLASHGSTFAATASSDGRIHLYDLTTLLESAGSKEPQEVAPMAAYDTKASRLTCVTITEGGEDYVENIMKRKRKHEEGDEEGNGDDGEVA